MAKRRQSEETENLTASNGSEPTFEESLERLEEIAEQLEEGKLGLSEALGCYEEGIKHLKLCHDLLGRAERKIELLTGIDAEGNAITEPFDDTASTIDKPKGRGARPARSESVPPAVEPDVEDVDDGELLF